ncbi:MAG: penicillin-binding protein 2 [Candidatus Magasanikbacteria bacterium]|nr:penicillin-binding protein 2 [Candidatus Magasanikbacteria bacterium]
MSPEDRQFKFWPESDTNRLKLKGKFRHSWIEESVQIKDPPASSEGAERFLGTAIYQFKANRLFFIITLALSLIIVQLIRLQLWQGSTYRATAEGNRIRIKPIIAERGIIYDRSGEQLVLNVPAFSLVLSLQDLPRAENARLETLEIVAKESGLDVPAIEDAINHYRSFKIDRLVIKDNLDYKTALRLYIQHTDLAGVAVESGMKRWYAQKFTDGASAVTSTDSLSHILGYLGKLTAEEYAKLSNSYNLPDEIGKAGLEKQYENILRGTVGRNKIEVDAIGKERAVLAVDPPAPGSDLYLTLDLPAQRYLEKLVATTAKRTGKKKFGAIALEPNTGKIIALVSWPAYDNNDFSGGISTQQFDRYRSDPNNPLFNRAITGLYPPGSTAKLMVAAAALEEGVVNETTGFNSTGGLEVGRWFFKDWKAGGHGFTNITRALAWSVNTYFYYVGGGYKNFAGLGLTRLYKYLAAFKINQPTGIDLPAEATGFIPTPEWKLANKGERWFVGDTYNISIGQGDLLVTPLQVARYTAAVANGGLLVTPHLAEKIIDPTSKLEQPLTFATEKIKDISPATMAIVRRGMRACVVSGSCQLLKTLPLASAGKTGTAQWSATKPTHAWFTAFAPFENPKIVVTVLAEEGGEGAAIAMPIARDFLSWWFKQGEN